MKQLLLKLIQFYQQYISPLSPPRCRYIPTCSQYAHEAITTHGAWQGGYLALKRILRCNPWAKRFGLDPVPAPNNKSCHH